MQLTVRTARWSIKRGRRPLLVVFLGLCLMSFSSCSKQSGSTRLDAGEDVEIETDTTTRIADTATEKNTNAPTDTGSEPGGTVMETDTTVGSDTISVPDTETDTAESTDHDTDQGIGGEGIVLDINSGALIGDSTNYKIHVFVGKTQLLRGRSTNYQITAGIGALTQP
jgi:hypothetical protein